MGWNVKALISTGLIVGGAILALIGYAQLLRLPEFGLTEIEVWRESILLTAGILVWPLGGPTLGFPRIHDIPLALEIARFMIPIGVFTGAALLLGRLFGAHIRAFLARFARNHVVVCADGPDAWQFVADLRRERRDRFVVVDLHAHRGNIHERPPVPILPASDGIDEGLLLRAAVPHARAIVALGNEDMRGLETVLRAKTVAARHRPRHMAPLMGRAAISAVSAGEATEALFGAHDRTFAFHPISIARNTVRMLLRAHPLDRDPKMLRGGRLHVRIVGFGALGQELALEIARSGHFADERTPIISIVDHQAAALFARLSQTRPEFAEAAEFRPVPADTPDLAVWDDSTHEPAPTRTVICLGAELPVLQIAAALRQRSTTAGEEAAPIFVHLANTPIAAGALRAAEPKGAAPPIVPFGDATSLFTREIVLNEALDTLAREVHEHYRDNRANEGDAGGKVAADLPWDDLPESFREANRHQADHILPKLRAIGCDALSGSEINAFAFQLDEIETLARIEHRRWNAERRVAGWRYAAARRDEAREHPSLVSWESLSEREREKDREAVRAIPDILARAGLVIRRGP